MLSEHGINPLCKISLRLCTVKSIIAWVEFWLHSVGLTYGRAGQWWVHDRQAAGWSAWAFGVQQSVRRAPMYPVLSTSNSMRCFLRLSLYFYYKYMYWNELFFLRLLLFWAHPESLIYWETKIYLFKKKVLVLFRLFLLWAYIYTDSLVLNSYDLYEWKFPMN